MLTIRSPHHLISAFGCVLLLATVSTPPMAMSGDFPHFQELEK